MKIHTYYHDCPDIDAESHLRLITLWRRHHEKLGLEPVVLTQYHARQHPYFKEFDDRVRRLPTTNPNGYDLACYHRWLAMVVALYSPHSEAGQVGLMADYDLFLRTDATKDLFLMGVPARVTVFENIVPCLVLGDARAFLQACTWFAEYPMPGTKHTSDMYILEQLAAKKPELFARYHWVKSYGESDWAKAPAVHFSTYSMEKQVPKWATIPRLLSL